MRKSFWKLVLERSNGLLVDWMVGLGWQVYVTPPRIVAHRLVFAQIQWSYTKSQKGLRIFLSFALRPNVAQNTKMVYTQVILGVGII